MSYLVYVLGFVLLISSIGVAQAQTTEDCTKLNNPHARSACLNNARIAQTRPKTRTVAAYRGKAYGSAEKHTEKTHRRIGTSKHGKRNF